MRLSDKSAIIAGAGIGRGQSLVSSQGWSTQERQRTRFPRPQRRVSSANS